MRRRSKIRLLIVAGVLVIVAAFLISLTFGGRRNEISALEKAGNNALAPAVGGAYKASTSVKDFFQRLFGIRDVDREYAELKIRLTELEVEYEWKQDLERENERLTRLLGFQESYPEYQYIHTEIIAKDPGSWFMTFTNGSWGFLVG